MIYLKEIKVDIKAGEGILYVTDNAETAQALQREGKAVLIYLHRGNALQGLPWNILETPRCLIRETTTADVEDFYRIYSHPAITKYMEGLYPEVEQEKQYVREYIEKVYTFYGFGVWTVVEKESGAVIGRAGLSYREGFEDPELGFIIGVPWQRRGYAWEVCRAILGYAAAVLEFTKVQALVETENTASLKLCEKLGFYRDSRVVLNGKKYDLLFAAGLSPNRPFP